MPEPIDVTQFAQGDGLQPPQEPQEPQPAPEPQPPSDPYKIKYRGEEREVPRELVDNFAPYLGTNPTGVINLLQRGREADRIWNENTRLQQEIEALRQERMGGFQAPAPAPYQQPQYQPPQPQYAPPPYGLQQPAQDDPIALINSLAQMQRMTHQEIQELRTTLKNEQESMRQQAQEQRENQQAREIDSMAEHFLLEHNKNRREQITKEEFLQEVSLSGGSNSYVPLDRAFDRAWRQITWDERGEAAQRDLMEKLRDPKAQVVVPGAPSSQTPAIDKRSEAEKALAGLTWGQAIEYIPEARR